MSIRSGQSGANPVQVSKALSLGWIIFVLVAYGFRHPYWSLMDDISNRVLVRIDWANLSWLQAIKEYVHTDLAVIGMFRPLYPAYCYWFYRIFMNHPAAGYSLLAVLLLSLFWGWALSFTKLTGWGIQSVWLYFILACTFTPHFNLFFHASLLEKFVILSGLGTIAITTAVLDTEFLPWSKTGLFALLYVLAALIGFLAKPNTLFILAPVCLLLFFDGLHRKQPQRWVLLAFIILFELGLGRYFLSIRGSYTSRYNFALINQRLFHPEGRFLIFEILGLAGLIPAFFGSLQDLLSAKWTWNSRRACWPVGLLAFLVIMMPWGGGIGAYYLAPGGVFVVGTVAQSLLWILQEEGRMPLLGPSLSALLVVLTITSAVTFYRRLETGSSIPLVSRWLQEKAQASGYQARFVMPTPCSEEHGSLAQFSQLPFLEALGDKIPEVDRGHPVYLVTLPNCPPRPIEGFQYQDPIFKMGYWKIYVSNTTREKS